MIIKNPLMIKKANLQSKTATPTTDSQTITADSGYDGLREVQVEAVTSSIDSNITASNIKKDVSILGVTGTYSPLCGISTSPTILTLELPQSETVTLEFNIYSGKINWGDNTSGSLASSKSHTYSSAGTYHIRIYPKADYIYKTDTTLPVKLGAGTVFNVKNIFGEKSDALNISNYLKKVSIGIGTDITTYAFQGCANAEFDISNLGASLYSGQSFTLLGAAFRYCSNFSGVCLLNKSIKSIAGYCFADTSITTLIIPYGAIATLTTTNALPSTIEQILVPSVVVSDYKTATNWVNFADKIFSM